MKLEDKRAVRALQMAVEAAETAIDQIELGLPADHVASAFSTNAGAALLELGAYTQRERKS